MFNDSVSTVQREALRQDIDRMSQILLNAQECYEMANYLIQTDERPKVNYLKKRNPFFEYIKHQSWRLMVIELCKLYYFKPGAKDKTDNREQFNLRHLIKRLQPGGAHAWIKTRPQDIALWLQELDRLDKFVLELLTIRDKRFAHDDRNLPAFNNVSRKYIHRMICISKDILCPISIAGLGETISLEAARSPAQALRKLIDKLAS